MSFMLNDTAHPIDYHFVPQSDPIIHQVSYAGNTTSLQALLRHPSCRQMINIRNKLGCTPLRLAATAGHDECVSLLLSHGANVDAIDIKAQTPLLVAVKNSKLKCIRLLLEAGACPDGDDGALCSPLYMAAMDGFLEAVKLLIKAGATLNSSRVYMGIDSSPLYVTIAYAHYECAKQLLMAGADPNYNIQRTVHSANNASPNRAGSLFHLLVRNKTSPLVADMIYEFGANPHIQDQSGRLARDISDQENEPVRSRVALLTDQVRSLRSICRQRIVLLLSDIEHVSLLPLPASLHKYLSYPEFSFPPSFKRSGARPLGLHDDSD